MNLFKRTKKVEDINLEEQEQWNLETPVPPFEKERSLQDQMDEVLARLDRIETKIEEL